MWRAFLRWLPPARAERVERTYREASRAVTGYMLGNILTSVIAGLIVLVTLFALGVPFPLLFGLWVALVDLLPLVGGLLAGVPTVFVAAIHSLPAGIVMVIVFLVYQQVENHVLNPVVMSKTVRLNPLWVLLAVLVGAKLGGTIGSSFGTFIGALIGIPAGGALQVIVRELRRNPEAEPAPGAPGDTPAPGAPGEKPAPGAPGEKATVP
jgi:predicted PurR-regulated permease PerM